MGHYANAARNRQIVALCRRGHSVKEIAATVGCSENIVYSWLARNPGLKSDNGRYRSRKKEKRDQRIIAMYSKGFMIREIEKSTQCTGNTIYKVIHSHGVTRPRIHNPRVKKRRDRRILALRRQGWTFQKIGRRVGCSTGVAYQVVSASGQFPPTTRKMTAAEAKRILTMRESGKTLRQIADAVNRRASVVHHVTSGGRLLWMSLQKKTILTEKRQRRVLELRRKHKTLSEIASVTNLPLTNVYQICAKTRLT